jgi:hypothetical protein
MQCSGQEYDKLVSEVVIKLWSYVSTGKDMEVITAALKYVNTDTLSLYKYSFVMIEQFLSTITQVVLPYHFIA